MKIIRKLKISALFLAFFGSLHFSSATPLAPGSAAPAFSAKNQEGQMLQLTDYKGKFVLLYFYPKDDTPGCTKEACAFRDEYARITKLNTVILGCSRQNEKSHQEFKKKYHLPFDLLADPDGKVSESFGIGSFPIVGALIGLTHRESVLISPDGKIVKHYEKVNPSTHANEVIQDIERAKH